MKLLVIIAIIAVVVMITINQPSPPDILTRGSEQTMAHMQTSKEMNFTGLAYTPPVATVKSEKQTAPPQQKPEIKK